MAIFLIVTAAAVSVYYLLKPAVIPLEVESEAYSAVALKQDSFFLEAPLVATHSQPVYEKQ
ncbi:hypothetical protein [Paenibacillus sp. J2TS4]|uniref:hypothetical protein n=1 Tax=Paenibacillus sp. J2TS4 TaxID=2807194 RepID=UPI001B1D2E56|nr:hypothetical protein [Paenibacillus sp. J2TS4]GIP35746.1 hypothetical protein J2TS4_49560 [Paenibacillus sp. J2TS4]